MRDSKYIVRFSDANWLKNTLDRVTIGGVGGIGSWVAFFLSRIGTPMLIYDFDTIDETNLGGQLYGPKHVSMLKTSGIRDVMAELSDYYGATTLDRFEENSVCDNIVFSCFDNMKTRKELFEAWCKRPGKELFIDGRMLAESFQIYCVTPDKIEDYRKTLFDDSEVPDLACSFKATSHCGAMIASNIISLYTNYLTNKNIGKKIRNLPFNINMEIPMIFYEAI